MSEILNDPKSETKTSLPSLKAVKGMSDVLPAEGKKWLAFEAMIRQWLSLYGYEFVRTPIVEHQAVFTRAVGAATDIVEKEMYSFTDRLNHDELVLRPEGTAAAVRMALEHHLLYDAPRRVWYMGPMFRHERPQKGRYRQFHQVGVEALGFSGAQVDVEMILMGARLWKMLGISDVELHINNLGQAQERAEYRQALIAYLEPHKASLDEDSQRRLYTNPLRILDSKDEAVKKIVEGAPVLSDFLKEESRAHFDQVLALLDRVGIVYRLNTALVRGLDYYNLTVFEWVSGAIGAQSTICGGGRYDGLIEMMGGKSTPACGFALGMERVMSLWHNTHFVDSATDVYWVYQTDQALEVAVSLSEQLREHGIRSMVHAGVNTAQSLKAQLKKADASGARWVCVVGQDELESKMISIKTLHNAQGEAVQGEQVCVAQESLLVWVSRALQSE